MKPAPDFAKYLKPQPEDRVVSETDHVVSDFGEITFAYFRYLDDVGLRLLVRVEDGLLT